MSGSSNKPISFLDDVVPDFSNPDDPRLLTNQGVSNSSTDSSDEDFRFFNFDSDGEEISGFGMGATTFKYPMNVGEEEQLHSVVFHINVRENTRAGGPTTSLPANYSPTNLQRPNEKGVENLKASASGLVYLGAYFLGNKLGKALGLDTTASAIAGGGSVVAAKDIADEITEEGGSLSETITQSIGVNFKRRRLLHSIQLFVSGPPSAQYAAKWENKDLGILAGAASTGQFSLGDTLRDVGEGGPGEGEIAIPGTNKALNLGQFKSLGSGTARTIIQGAASLPDKIGISGDLGAAFDLLSGNTLNPYREQLFQYMDFRSFAFNYKFSPRNRQEHEQVMQIVQLFKFHMHPERNDTNMTLIYPSEFEIEYLYKNNKNEYINKIAPCALTDVKVSYGGQDSFSTFQNSDGAPVEINLSLAFTELEMLTRRGVNDAPGTGVSDNWRDSY